MLKLSLENEHIKKIRSFLNVSEKDRRISEKIEEYFETESEIWESAKIISEFIGYFNLFDNLEYLKREVLDCILDTLEICSNLEELMDSLLKTTLFRILELFLDYSKLQGDKDKVIKTLSTSFEILAPSALIINLGMMAKPVFEDTEYQGKKAAEAQVQIEEIDHSKTSQEIKNKISTWIESQPLSLEQQAILNKNVEDMAFKYAEELKMDIESKQFKNLVVEVKEMVNLKLTALSLILDFGDEDLSPQPLSL